MKKATNIILVAVVLIAIVIFKQITKQGIKDNAVNNTLETKSTSSNNDNTKKINDDISNQNWFINTQFGLAVETPKKMVETPFSIPRGTEEYISDITVYVYKDNEMAMNYMIMEIKSSQYDTKVGLKGAVSNLINSLNGTNLKVDYFAIENQYNDHGCEGTCLYKSKRLKIRGYCLFNEKGRVYILVAVGPDNNIINKKMERIFNSIKIINL